MFLVNTVNFNAAELGTWGQLLFMVLQAGFVLLIWILAMGIARSENRNVKFACGAGLYGCYIVGSCVFFILITPISVQNMVEGGIITLADASIYSGIVSSIAFAFFNLVALACVIAWHVRKQRKAMSEMDRMKLEDM